MAVLAAGLFRTHPHGRALGKGDILADLVGGMNFTPAAPDFQQMRDGILMGLTASGNDSRACMVWDSFAQFGVGSAPPASSAARRSP